MFAGEFEQYAGSQRKWASDICPPVPHAGELPKRFNIGPCPSVEPRRIHDKRNSMFFRKGTTECILEQVVPKAAKHYDSDHV